MVEGDEGGLVGDGKKIEAVRVERHTFASQPRSAMKIIISMVIVKFVFCAVVTGLPNSDSQIRARAEKLEMSSRPPHGLTWLINSRLVMMWS